MIRRKIQTIDLCNGPTPATPPQESKIRGLGDIVHKIAQPIAKLADRGLGTRLVGCSACAARRRKWNRRFPLRK